MQMVTHVIPNLLKPLLSLCWLMLLVASAGASVRVYVEEAGGKLTNLAGGAPDLNRPQFIAAATPELHAEVSGILMPVSL